MSNPTELPDLEGEKSNFEAWAGVKYRNVDEYTNLDHDRGWQAWRERARRAQPEGEAPQDDLTRRQKENAEFSEWWASSGQQTTHDLITENAAHATWQERARRAATLSPLCGAQHAESGKEAADEFGEIMLAMQIAAEKLELIAAGQAHGKDYDLNGEKVVATIKHAKGMAAYALERLQPACVAVKRLYRSTLAAQQAAAPCSLEGRLVSVDVSTGDDDYANRIFAELTGETGSDGMTLIAIEKSRNFSAPGTPEAPKDERKGIELWRATLRACGELPEGYEVRIELENGCGMAVWYDAEGERHVIDGDGYLSDDVNEAVDAAIERAAQLDGGQEASDHG